MPQRVILQVRAIRDKKRDLDINISGLLNEGKRLLFKECLKRDDLKGTSSWSLISLL
jgi:hypothetical protein